MEEKRRKRKKNKPIQTLKLAEKVERIEERETTPLLSFVLPHSGSVIGAADFLFSFLFYFLETGQGRESCKVNINLTATASWKESNCVFTQSGVLRQGRKPKRE